MFTLGFSEMKAKKVSLVKKQQIIAKTRTENYESSLKLEGLSVHGRLASIAKKRDKKDLIEKYRVA